MDKTKIYRYFNGELNEVQQEELLTWVKASPANRAYFKQQYKVWLASGMPGNSRAVLSDASMQREMEEVRKAVRSGNGHREERKSLRGRLIFYAAAAVVIVALFFDGFHRIELSRNVDSLRAAYSERVLCDNLQDSLRQEVYTPAGVKSEVTLPDGSVVKMNSDTRLAFPLRFSGPTREVSIDGEGYFKVVSDSLMPMIVNTPRGYSICVKGTEFNVRAYAQDEAIRTTLYKGRVEIVKLGDHIHQRKVIAALEPGNAFEQCRTEQRSRLIKTPDLEMAKAWTAGLMVFNAVPMRTVLQELERWHGVQCYVDDPSIFGMTLTAEFANESLVQVMEAIKFSSGLRYRIKGRTVYIFH